MTLWRIRATVDDRPGYLSVLTASLALRGVNILAVQVHTTEAGAVDDFLVDAPPTLTATDLIAAVERGRGRDCWVARSEARGLVDQPTRALALASRLVHDPDALGEALGTLLGADAVTWRPTPVAVTDRRDRAEIMRLPDPTGGAFEVRRSAPSFTPAEYARAQALVDLAAGAARRAAERVNLLLADGTELLVRPATGDDLPAVAAMHERCTARSRRLRYPAADGAPTPARLRRLLDPDRGITLLAIIDEPAVGSGDGSDDADGGRVVAMASLVAEGVIGELAVLVEDAWQRRGVGTALLRRLVSHADATGYAALVAHTQVDDPALRRTLYRLRRQGSIHRDGTMSTVTVALPGAERVNAAERANGAERASGAERANGADAPAPSAPHPTPAVRET